MRCVSIIFSPFLLIPPPQVASSLSRGYTHLLQSSSLPPSLPLSFLWWEHRSTQSSKFEVYSTVLLTAITVINIRFPVWLINKYISILSLLKQPNQYPNKSKLFTRQLLHLLRSSQKSRPTIHIAFLFWSSYNFSHSLKHWIPESFSRARKILISLISSESSMYIVQFGQPSRSLADSCWLAQCQEWTECRGKEGQAKNVHVCMISQVNINNLYCIYTVRLAKYLK